MAEVDLDVVSCIYIQVVVFMICFSGSLNICKTMHVVKRETTIFFSLHLICFSLFQFLIFFNNFFRIYIQYLCTVEAYR
jgi:hypothetical protein